VHEHFICAKSKVFRTACSERGTVFFGVRVVRLADAEPRTLKNYLKWVYTNEIVVEVEDVPDKTLRVRTNKKGSSSSTCSETRSTTCDYATKS
jgi:uncharacterized protein (DUF2249 family)